MLTGFSPLPSWGRGKQLSVALVVVLVVAVAVGAIFDRLAGSTPDSLPLLTLPNSIVTIAQSPPSVNPTASPATQSAPVTAPTIGTINPPTSGTVAVASPVAADGTMNTLDVLAAIPGRARASWRLRPGPVGVVGPRRRRLRHLREEVLIEESLSQARRPVGCAVVAGDWFSAYDGAVTTSPTDLDIDHVVALKEAWDSGAWNWAPDRRIAFANDTSDSRTLIAVSTASNQDKGDKDPSNWGPRPEDVCRFIADWLAVKARWSLTMDPSEWGRLRGLLSNQCPDSRITHWDPPASDEQHPDSPRSRAIR